MGGGVKNRVLASEQSRERKRGKLSEWLNRLGGRPGRRGCAGVESGVSENQSSVACRFAGNKYFTLGVSSEMAPPTAPPSCVGMAVMLGQVAAANSDGCCGPAVHRGRHFAA